jgi:hypothetical protein
MIYRRPFQFNALALLMSAISGVELKKLVIALLKNAPMQTSALARAIAMGIELDTEKRKELADTLRSRLTRLLPGWDEVQQIQGTTRQTGKFGEEYTRRGPVWELASRVSENVVREKANRQIPAHWLHVAGHLWALAAEPDSHNLIRRDYPQPAASPWHSKRETNMLDAITHLQNGYPELSKEIKDKHYKFVVLLKERARSEHLETAFNDQKIEDISLEVLNEDIHELRRNQLETIISHAKSYQDNLRQFREKIVSLAEQVRDGTAPLNGRCRICDSSFDKSMEDQKDVDELWAILTYDALSPGNWAERNFLMLHLLRRLLSC